MKNILYFLLAMFIVVSCSSSKNSGFMSAGTDFVSPNLKQELIDQNTFKITAYSQDKTYGYTQKNAILVGGAMNMEGPLNERRFLNALTGPAGEEISYHRAGSCCDVQTKNSSFGGGKLDMYRVTYAGLTEPVTLYINMYDSDTLKVPVGFKLKEFATAN